MLVWFESIADEDLYLPAVTLGEIQAGIEITRNTADFKPFGVHLLNPFKR